MISIELTNAFVGDILEKVLIACTDKLTGIKLDTPQTRKRKIENPISVVILSKGIFKSKVVGTFPSAYAKSIVEKMSHGAELSEEEQDAYFKEYINICFGRFISCINNEIGHASRFVIPVLIRGAYKDTAEGVFKNRLDLVFCGPYGRIEFVVKYEVLPEHSSN